MEFKKGQGMAREDVKADTVAEAYLQLLAARGVEYLFANAGTDFAPLIEAYASASSAEHPVPKPMLATHEHVAASMAHGYGMVSGKVPAVMVHVSVGTGNMICAALNAARENVPMLLSAGRSPITEEGLAGARDAYIHWGQEMYDQAGMVREVVKWEYELRNAEQLETVVDRALNIASSEPCGPVYLSLPREVIAQPMPKAASTPSYPRKPPAPPRPDAGAIAEAAQILADAESPLIVTINAGRDKATVPVLAEFAEQFAIPVVQHKPRYMALPSGHPMNLGFEPSATVTKADAILVLEADVPWIPSRVSPPAECRIIHAGLDPLFSRYPIRGFRSDLAVAGHARAVLADLAETLAGRIDGSRVGARRSRIAAQRAEAKAAWEKLITASRTTSPIHPAWISHCISAAKGDDAIVVNEYTLLLEHCRFVEPGTYFGSSSASGLGWGLGAAIGAKLAAPERLVIATLGDGAYIFSNPVAGHHAAKAHDLPILTVVFNNAMWNAVRKATVDMYPQGRAAKSNKPAFVHLEDLPAFEQVCAAAGGYGERVEDPAELPKALERGIAAVTRERRQALLNVICQSP